ncbi:MAG: S8 family serine peptidase [Miltoncostaeaceae bacterium]
MPEQPSRALLAALAGIAALAVAPALAGATGVAKEPDPVRDAATGGGTARVHSGAGGVRTLLVTHARPPRPAAARRALAPLGAVHPVVPEAGVWRVSVPPGPGAARARARALDVPGVIGAEWSMVRVTDQAPEPPVVPAPPEVPQAEPVTDPLFSQFQWGLAPATRAPRWSIDLTSGSEPTRIAVLDSGVDGDHPEWRGRLVHPRDTIRRNADADDHGFSGHGTHVAGVAAAPADGIGMVGVSPTSEVIPVRIANPEGRSTDAGMIAGIRWAVIRGAKVINISAGGPDPTLAFAETVLWATDRGALIVASVGNEGLESRGRTVNYPAGYPRVVGVAAQCDASRSSFCARPYGRAAFSNVNESVDLVAPGVNVLSTVPRRVSSDIGVPGYTYKSGTSMAAPYVTGVAALIQAANGNDLSPHQVARQLILTTSRIERAGRTLRTGYGLVDPTAAVRTAPPADDADEVNDDIRWVGRPLDPPRGEPQHIDASVDHREDREDVYPVLVRRGERLDVIVRYRTGRVDLYLWGPGARTVATEGDNVRRNLVATRLGRVRTKRITLVPERPGIQYVNVYSRAGRSDYRAIVTVRRGR